MSSLPIHAHPLSRPSEDAAPYPGRLAGQAVCADCWTWEAQGLELVASPYRPLARVCERCRFSRIAQEARMAAEYDADREASRAEWDHFGECPSCEKWAIERVPVWERRALCPMRRSA